ncbi:MAG: CHASE domain-containing protein [Candidatus Kapabacteria bacterium]|nr:CHASE domain-containing protein [Candidatus Kapabacteria bacterium]MDW8225095.1 CHASE domain-containing protein [Bacteroidota bacterium]
MVHKAQLYEELFAQSDSRRIRVWQVRVTYPAFVVFALLLAVTIALWWLVRLQIRAEQEALFERAVSSVLSRIERQARQYEQVLHSVQGLYGSFVQVVRDVFELYATVPARSNPAVLSIGYAPCIENRYVWEYTHYARSERYWDYQIFPAITGPYLFPLLYVVPVETAPQRVGWNAAAHSTWYTAIDRACSTGAPTTTPWMALRTDPDTVWGFALIAPLYREQPHPFTQLRVGEHFVEGIVVVEVVGDRFFQQALITPAPTDSLIVFEAFDSQLAPDGTVHQIRIVESPNRLTITTAYVPTLTTQRELRIGDRAWRFHFATVPQFEGMYQRWLPWLVLGSGIIIATVGFGFVLSLVTTRARAVGLANRMTKAQRRILEASHDIIAVWELDGRWRTANPALRAILGYAPEELSGRAVDEWVVPAQRGKFRQMLLSAPDEEAVAVELLMQTRSGEQRWVGWSLTLSQHDGVIYAIGRDITTQKELQHRQELVQRRLLLAEQWALEASEFKSEFLNRLSFRLRNGLTGLMGFVELIAQRQYDSEEELQSYADAVQESVEHLLGLVAETPEIAAATPIARHPVLLGPFLAELAAWAEGEGFRLHLPSLPEDARVLAEKELLQKALRSLLRGIAESGECEEISLHIDLAPYEEGSEWSISAPASEALCRAATLVTEFQPFEALTMDDSQGTFSLLLAQAVLRRLRSAMRAECLDGTFVIIFTLPIQRAEPYGLPSSAPR